MAKTDNMASLNKTSKCLKIQHINNKFISVSKVSGACGAGRYSNYIYNST